MLESQGTGTWGETVSEPNPLFPLSFFFLSVLIHHFLPSVFAFIPYFLSYWECTDPRFQLASRHWLKRDESVVSWSDRFALFNALWMARHLTERGFLRDWAGINSLKWFIMYAQSVKLEVFSNYLARTTLRCMAWQHELTVSSHYHSTFKSHNRSYPISAINGKELLFIFALDHLSGRTGFPQSENLKEISRTYENKKLQ